VEYQKFWVEDGRRQDILAYSSVEENWDQSVLNSQMMRYNNHRSGIYHKGSLKWISFTAY
jgi:hypothetical protein